MSQVTPFPSDGQETTDRATGRGVSARRPVTPEEMAAWLNERRESLSDRWLIELRSRAEGIEGPLEELMREFIGLLVALLPRGFGVYREQAISIFHQAAELYGNLGAIRGLAAGEAVEEVQLLREVLFRFLFQEPPGGTGVGLGLREFLQLSRLVDQAVTHASVGHTDTLFFNLFHGTGVPESPAQDVVDEVREQVRTLRSELDALQSLEEGEVARG